MTPYVEDSWWDDCVPRFDFNALRDRVFREEYIVELPKPKSWPPTAKFSAELRSHQISGIRWMIDQENLPRGFETYHVTNLRLASGKVLKMSPYIVLPQFEQEVTSGGMLCDICGSGMRVMSFEGDYNVWYKIRKNVYSHGVDLV